MAEFRKLPTQAELQNMLFMEQMRIKNPQQIAQEALASGTTISPLPENVFQKIAGGAGIAKEYVNRAGTAADLAKLFPGYKPQTKVTIPTGYNFAPKQDPMGGVIPGGLQTQDMNLGQVLGAIKPADVLGISGAERAYSDIGAGKAPQPLDVLDVAGLGATGLVGGKAALKTMKGMPVGLSIQEAKGLLTEAPRSPLGFYSALEESALNLQRNKGSGQAFLNDLQKAPNVKADEIKWTGLDEFLKTKPNVTKQEVQDYIANNRVDIQEVTLSDTGLRKKFSVNSPEDQDLYDVVDKNNKVVFTGNIDDADYFIDRSLTKFSQYTLPGGENYRELILTMPAKQLTEAEARTVLGAAPNAKLSAEDIAYASRKNANEYKSSHFPEQQNPLAHIRVNDRIDADGKKMLLIEEVQSDWHQAGRDKGYKSEAKDEYFRQIELEKKFDAKTISPTEQIELENLVRRRAATPLTNRVPDAPFKDTWYQLALKRAVQYAAENGYDRIGLTTGSQQATRFDLSKQISELHYSGTNLVAYDKAGNQVIQQTGVAEADLPGLIGKEAAKKLIEQPKQGTLRSLVGQELQVGGEGMKKYYDEIYPKFLDKYGKKWNARVGETKIRTHSDKQVQEDLDLLEQLGEDRSKFSDSGMARIRYLDVTPEMRSSVSKGQPLFQALPAIPATGLLATQDENR